jgi:hypothetical protein
MTTTVSPDKPFPSMADWLQEARKDPDFGKYLGSTFEGARCLARISAKVYGVPYFVLKTANGNFRFASKAEYYRESQPRNRIVARLAPPSECPECGDPLRADGGCYRCGPVGAEAAR